jgi:cobalt-zinc-cadmium efflux system protein
MMHQHSHTDTHAHPAGHNTDQNILRLGIVLAITALYMLIEFFGGLWVNSLALLADAGHMLTDVGAIGLALFAAWFSKQPCSSQKTYGYYRLEIFAALINGIALALISFFILYEAFMRLQHPLQIRAGILIWIASGGFILNLVSASILFKSSQHNINIRSAFFHVLSDSLGTLGTVIAGVFIYFWNFYQADPILSMAIALLVLINGWKLIQEATNILLEACPVHLSVADIESALIDLHEIRAVHDLHVWSITSGKEALSVHLVVEDAEHYTPELVMKVQQVLKEKFGLTHLTVQLETPNFEEDSIHF